MFNGQYNGMKTIYNIHDPINSLWKKIFKPLTVVEHSGINSSAKSPLVENFDDILKKKMGAKIFSVMAEFKKKVVYFNISICLCENILELQRQYQPLSRQQGQLQVTRICLKISLFSTNEGYKYFHLKFRFRIFLFSKI